MFSLSKQRFAVCSQRQYLEPNHSSIERRVRLYYSVSAHQSHGTKIELDLERCLHTHFMWCANVRLTVVRNHAQETRNVEQRNREPLFAKDVKNELSKTVIYYRK